MPTTGTMGTTGPAARTAHSIFELGKAFPDANISRLGQFAGYDPANPFVAGQRGYIIPDDQSFRRRNNSPP